ncbi:MAG: hypothetical protein H7X79_05925 [Sporomusaceae bacterium]|nr:hypothetical protein [Sporomusaceae bacterium]
MKDVEKTPIVTYVTRVGLTLEIDPDVRNAVMTKYTVGPEMVRELGREMAQRMERIAAIMELLTAKGFVFEIEKQAVYACSNKVEAQEIKRCMLDAGFKDREFQLVLEYTRGWGML